MAESIMPWLYSVLALSLAANTVGLLLVWIRINPEPTVLAVGLMIGFEAVSISLLAILTGPFPILDIDHYRPLVVALRGAMVPVSLVLSWILARRVQYHLGRGNRERQTDRVD